MSPKILMAVTSHDKKGETGEATGYYLSEVSHPWRVFTGASHDLDYVSPRGGKAPVEAEDRSDPINAAFLEDSEAQKRIGHSSTPAAVNPDDYAAVFFAGGHGAMWDFPDDTGLADIARRIYEQGGVVAAVCHGPAALINVRLHDGDYLVKGCKVNAFTNDEERAVGMDEVVPFLLESRLRERGAIFEKSDPFQEHVAEDGRLITGQNPQSATAVARAVVRRLKQPDGV